MFTPYAAVKVKHPERLPKRVVSPRRYKDQARTDVQCRMIRETVGGFDEPTEEDIYSLVDLLVKHMYNRGAEEAVH